MKPEHENFVSDGLGLPMFPAGTEESTTSRGEPDRQERDPEQLGDHVMGAVVLGWLTHIPLTTWGPSWAASGAMEARFRAHLTTGVPLTIAIERDGERLDLTVADADVVYATASASPRGDVAGDVRRDAVPEPGKARPVRADLEGRVLAPLEFRFAAERDLAFTAGIGDGAFWRARRWAHPAWVAAGTNAMIRRNIDFGVLGQWTNAGIGFTLHGPVEDGATIRLDGAIDTLFDRPPRHFAVATISASVDGQPVSSWRNTLVYGTDVGLAPIRGRR